ncbi:HAUS augmin-like complex subunit 3 isoform X2 [Epinephelus fuscoguttatus]|uniref:HAUS augmin-like complex subunit 3 isoform X2 n=1 Tax=Epinephelus fuscoguttatus TaxID=293821 RepID=UPI0020D195EB|nr:HAUS augmin-like complex subunit 3 isoform X2 [Epinephelus fuscoguttatus]
MEQSSSRLYSENLSQEAQKILAVLRAQSLHAARRSHSYSYNHRQIVERYNGSQREPWAQSSWSMSQEESKEGDSDRPWFRPQVSSYSTSYRDASHQPQSSQTSACYQHSQTPDCSLSSQASSGSSSCWDSSLHRQVTQTEAHYRCSQIYSHRKCSEPPACPSSQALSFTQHEETVASFSHRDRYTLSLQTPERLCEHQATPWRNSAEEIRPPFIHNLSPYDEDPDEGLCPTTEHPNTHKAEPTLACHRLSSCHIVSEETDNDASGAQKENKDTESWHITREKLDHTVVSDSQTKWKLSLSTPSAEVISEEDGGILNHKSAEEVQQIFYSENIMQAGAAEMSDRGHKVQEDAPIPDERGSANEMEGHTPSETNENTSVERNLNSIFTTSLDDSVLCYSKQAKLGQEEDNDLEYRVDRSEIKGVEHLLGIEKIELSVGRHTGSPKKISISLEREEHKVSHCQSENTQGMSQTVTETAEKQHIENPLMQCEPTKLVLGDTAADNPERTTEERGDVMEVIMGLQRESIAGIDTSIEEKMETEQHHYSDVPTRESQNETNNREVNELPETGERGEDRNVSAVPPVDSQNESTSADFSHLSFIGVAMTEQS